LDEVRNAFTSKVSAKSNCDSARTGLSGMRSSDLLGARASRPQMSAKRENDLGATSERLRACGAFAGGTPAFPINHLIATQTEPLQRPTLF